MNNVRCCDACSVSSFESTVKFVEHFQLYLCTRCAVDIVRDIVSLYDRDSIYENGLSETYGMFTVHYKNLHKV